jgi:hypothetical protein
LSISFKFGVDLPIKRTGRSKEAAMAGLFGSSVLEVVLGLSFIYFVLSLICSQINEILAGLLKWRARDLELGIQNLLCDQATADAVLKHPLIKAMGNTNAETPLVRLATLLRLAPSRAGKPGYISSGTFVQALFDQLAPAKDGPITIERLTQRVQQLANTTFPQKPEKFMLRDIWSPSKEQEAYDKAESEASLGRALLSLLEQSTPSQTIRATVAGVEQLLEKFAEPQKQLVELIKKAKSSDEIRAIVAAMPISDTRTAILNLLDTTQTAGAISRFMGTTLSPTETVRTLVETLPKLSGYDALKAAVNGKTTLDDIRQSLLTLPESDLRMTVLTFIDQGQANLEAARTTVETWYNDAMDRVSGVYKRRIQMWLLGIGLIVVVFTGTDTFKIVKTLTTNTNLRTAIAARADATVASGASDLPGATRSLSSAQVMTTTSTVSDTTTVTTTLTTAISNTNALLAELGAFGQLFGYNDVLLLLDDQEKLPDTQKTCRATATWWQEGACWESLDWQNSIGWLLWKIVGLAISVFAVSLGAPFWFDMLKQISNIRASGPPPEKTEPVK